MCSFSHPLLRAFTLIELLIVVAIIAILAAIAVPNFLEAQTRSKVSRCQADMRSFAIALESYAIDNNRYPPYGRIKSDDSFQYPGMDNVGAFTDKMAFVSPLLTTPLAYCSVIYDDAFMTVAQGPREIRWIEYLNIKQHMENLPTPPGDFLGKWGPWRLCAAGPDRDRGQDTKMDVFYDPTNGTVSDGDITRSQRFVQSGLK